MRRESEQRVTDSYLSRVVESEDPHRVGKGTLAFGGRNSFLFEGVLVRGLEFFVDDVFSHRA